MKDPEENINHQEEKRLEIETGLETILQIVMIFYSRDRDSQDKDRRNSRGSNRSRKKSRNNSGDRSNDRAGNGRNDSKQKSKKA